MGHTYWRPWSAEPTQIVVVPDLVSPAFSLLRNTHWVDYLDEHVVRGEGECYENRVACVSSCLDRVAEKACTMKMGILPASTELHCGHKNAYR